MGRACIVMVGGEQASVGRRGVRVNVSMCVPFGTFPAALLQVAMLEQPSATAFQFMLEVSQEALSQVSLNETAGLAMLQIDIRRQEKATAGAFARGAGGDMCAWC